MIAARSTASTLKFVVVVIGAFVSIGIGRCLQWGPTNGNSRKTLFMNLKGIVYFTRFAPLCCFKFIHMLYSIIQSSSCMYVRMKKLECLSLMFSTMCSIDG